jgi:hypothetical protein
VTRPRGGTWVRPDGAVDSIQWLDLDARRARGAPDVLDLAALERAYFAWVPRMAAGVVGPQRGRSGTDQPLRLGLLPWAWPVAIAMQPPETGPGRRARSILGGALAFAGGALAFELEPRPGDLLRVRVALTGFRPRAPLVVYLVTQRRLHERSTFAFLREVGRRVESVCSNETQR